MATTIDAAGRLVIPKAVRDAAGIRPGAPLEIRYRDGRIEIEPAPLGVDLVERDGVVVAQPREDLPTLRADHVEAVRERLRTER